MVGVPKSGSSCGRAQSGRGSARLHGLITAKWGKSPTGRRARYYTITASGRRHLGQEVSDFDKVLLAIDRVLGRA